MLDALVLRKLTSPSGPPHDIAANRDGMRRNAVLVAATTEPGRKPESAEAGTGGAMLNGYLDRVA